MSPLELQEEKLQKEREYKALKSLVGEMMLEHDGAEESEEFAYFHRKFTELKKLRG